MDPLPLATGQAPFAALQRQIEGHRKSIDDAIETLGRLIDAPEALTWLAQIRAMRGRYVTSSARVLDLMEEGAAVDAVNLMNAETLPALQALQGPIKGLLELQMKNLPQGNALVQRQIDSALTLMKVLDGAPAAVWQSPARGEV